MTTTAAPGLAGYQRQHLKGLAHDLKPVVQVGRAGVTDEVVAAVGQALLDHELIKVRLYDPEDKRKTAASLAARADAVLCGVVGHTVILYRRHPKAPKIKVPTRKAPGAAG
ncbi:MAG: ribosome assembly RNA-binding protein YhbY [Deltaproteobacteria bacterium]|nr:ribosome assembly RNA-binding protein YhbY [Deltaproteobacteria bacterium]